MEDYFHLYVPLSYTSLSLSPARLYVQLLFSRPEYLTWRYTKDYFHLYVPLSYTSLSLSPTRLYVQLLFFRPEYYVALHGGLFSLVRPLSSTSKFLSPDLDVKPRFRWCRAKQLRSAILMFFCNL